MLSKNHAGCLREKTSNNFAKKNKFSNTNKKDEFDVTKNIPKNGKLVSEKQAFADPAPTQ